MSITKASKLIKKGLAAAAEEGGKKATKKAAVEVAESAAKKKEVKAATKAVSKAEAKAATDISSTQFENFSKEFDAYFKSGEKVPDDLRARAERAGFAQLVKNIDAHNAGKNISEASGSRKEYRGGLTKKEAKTVRKFGRADEADEQAAKDAKTEKTISEKLADEKKQRLDELDVLKREEKSPEKRAAYEEEYKQLKTKNPKDVGFTKETFPINAKEYADVKALQALREKNEELLFPETTAGRRFEEATGFPEPVLPTGQVSPARKISYEDIPAVGIPPEEKEALLAKRVAQKEKDARDEAARIKEAEAEAARKKQEEEGKELVRTPIEVEIPGYGKVKGERIETKVTAKKAGETNVFSKPEQEIASVESPKPSVAKAPEVKEESKTTVEKLKEKQPKKSKKEEKLEEVVAEKPAEEPATAAVAETPAAPAVDGDAPLKGKSLREVDAIVQANPKRKAEAVKYAKARNEKRWSKWAEATESKATSAEQNKFLAKLRNTAAERGDVPAAAPVAAETPALPAPIPAAKGAPKPEIQKVSAADAAPTTEAFKGKSAKEVLDMATTDPKLRAEAIAYAKAKAESTGKTNWSRAAQLLEESTPKDAVGKKSLSTIQKTFKDTEEVASQAEKPSTLGRNIGLTAGGLGIGSAVVSQKQLVDEKGQKAAVENLNTVIGDMTKTPVVQKDEEDTTEEPLTAEDTEAKPMKREAQKAGAPVQFNVESPAQLDKLAQVTLEGGTEPTGELAQAKDSLSAQLKTAKQIYEQATKQAKTEAEQRETAILMGRLFEQAAQALIKYFAAKEGKRLGARIGSDLKFDKHDWSADLDRSMKKLDAELEAAKETYGVAIKRVESAERRQEQAAIREETAKQRQENILLQDRLARERALEGQQARATESEKERAFREKENALNRQQSAENARLRLENSAKKLEEGGKAKEADRINRLTGAAAEASSTFNSAYKSRKKMEESTQAKFSKAMGDLALTEQESAEIADLLQNKPGDAWGPFDKGDEVNMAKARQIFYKAAERQAGAYKTTPTQRPETSELQRIDNVIRKLESKKQRTPEEQKTLSTLREARSKLAAPAAGR